MIRLCEASDLHAIYAIINDAAQAYKGVIPEDRWHDPYMSLEELEREIAQGVGFWGCEEGGELIGVIGLQHVQDVSLIRHAYVRTGRQRQGVSTRLLAHLRTLTAHPMLVGTWADAVWAIRFYQKHGFRLVCPEEKDRLLRKYWSIPERQVETSMVLADERWFGDEIVDTLVKRGEELLARPFETIQFTANAEADALLNDLDHYPHAYVIACLMDRQIKAERAWLIPYLIQERVGSFAFAVLRDLSLDRVHSLMREPEPLHWLLNAMAKTLFLAIQRIGDQYSGDASRIWRGTPSSATLVRRFLEFHGAGPKIATMAANILVRDFKIPVSDKYSIDISPDRHVRRVFVRLGLARKGASNEELTYVARELHPTYPGIFDLSLWEIGKSWCHSRSSECDQCYLQQYCPTAGTRTHGATGT